MILALQDAKAERGKVRDEHDPALQTAFALAGRGLIPPQDLERIARHTFEKKLLVIVTHFRILLLGD